MAFVFQVDQILHELFIDDMLSIWYQATPENCESWNEDKLWNLGIYHQYYQGFANVIQFVGIIVCSKIFVLV